MSMLLAGLIAAVALGAGLSGGQAGQTFTGIVSDERCAADHAAMRMGPTDGECTLACHLEHGDPFVLVDGERVYGLTDQETPKRFAGQKVKVTGTLDEGSRTIRVESMTAE